MYNEPSILLTIASLLLILFDCSLVFGVGPADEAKNIYQILMNKDSESIAIHRVPGLILRAENIYGILDQERRSQLKTYYELSHLSYKLQSPALQDCQDRTLKILTDPRLRSIESGTNLYRFVASKRSQVASKCLDKVKNQLFKCSMESTNSFEWSMLKFLTKHHFSDGITFEQITHSRFGKQASLLEAYSLFLKRLVGREMTRSYRESWKSLKSRFLEKEAESFDLVFHDMSWDSNTLVEDFDRLVRIDPNIDLDKLLLIPEEDCLYKALSYDLLKHRDPSLLFDRLIFDIYKIEEINDRLFEDKNISSPEVSRLLVENFVHLCDLLMDLESSNLNQHCDVARSFHVELFEPNCSEYELEKLSIDLYGGKYPKLEEYRNIYRPLYLDSCIKELNAKTEQFEYQSNDKLKDLIRLTKIFGKKFIRWEPPVMIPHRVFLLALADHLSPYRSEILDHRQDKGVKRLVELLNEVESDICPETLNNSPDIESSYSSIYRVIRKTGESLRNLSTGAYNIMIARKLCTSMDKIRDYSVGLLYRKIESQSSITYEVRHVP